MDDPYWKISLTIRHCSLYAFGIVMACPDSYGEELKLQGNQAVWRLNHSIAIVRSKTAAKRLILK